MKHPTLLPLLRAGALATCALFMAPLVPAGELPAGSELKAESVMRDIGLPIYPGARPQLDRDGDKSSVSMGLWAGLFGLRLQLSKFQSEDGVDAVAAFYREALARHGTLLDCSQPAPRPEKEAKASKDEDERLSCGRDRAEEGGRLYKVGTKKNFRVVAIKPVGSGAHFQVVRIVLGSGS